MSVLDTTKHSSCNQCIKVVLYCMVRCFCFRADSITALLSHAMLHAEIRFTRPVLNIHRSGALTARYGSGDSSVV